MSQVMRNRIAVYASFVKVEHTVFSLPLIFAGALLHLKHWPSARLMVLMLIAAGCGRIVAMGLNRLIDADLDARNPRTQRRELARGAMRRSEAWAVVVGAGLSYVAAAAAISPLCLRLSPVPVALFVVYPYLKRVTSLAHLGLGLAWSMGPLGGWLAAGGTPDRFREVIWLWIFSILWVAGFDVIYATMDERFDRAAGLHSLPVQLGRKRALQLAALLHACAFLMLAELWRNRLLSRGSLGGILVIGVLFLIQHLVAEKAPEFAFFHVNAVLGFVVLFAIYTGV